MERFELEPNRDLLDPHFESYKLSLDPCPIFTCAPDNFPQPRIQIRNAGDDQFSFQHSKLFGSTNLLVGDPWNPDLVFMLDPVGPRVLHVEFEAQGVTGTPFLNEVWAAPSGLKAVQSGDYNPSLVFASSGLALITDGSGMFFIASTGDRKEGLTWKSEFHDEICGSNRPFVLSSAQMSLDSDVSEEKPAPHQSCLQSLIHYVEDKVSLEGLKPGIVPDSINYVNVAEWLTLIHANGSWTLERVRRFVLLGSTDYLQLSKGGNHLICLTDKPFNLIFDSSGQLQEDEPVSDAKAAVPEEPTETLPAFYWYQNPEDIAVWVVLPKTAVKRDLVVEMKPSSMKVLFQGQPVFQGSLWRILDGDSMSWTLEKGKLEINLTKANEGLIWQRFLETAQDDGEEIGNPAMIDSIVEGIHARADSGPPIPSLNADQLEECDAFPDDASNLYIFESSQNKVVSKASLSGHKHLFNLQISPNGPCAICLRYDVDGLVWQPETHSTEGSIKTRHCGTFQALGYVQASKEMRKFSTAAPDMSYVALVDRIRHVYIYRQPAAIAAECDLRNRKSGQKVSQIAKQQVITLDNTDEIVGALATSRTLVILTTSSLHCIRI